MSDDLISQLERQAAGLRSRATREYQAGRYRRAAEWAEKAVALHGSPANRRLLACARLMAGDFTGALSTYRKHQALFAAR